MTVISYSCKQGEHNKRIFKNLKSTDLNSEIQQPNVLDEEEKTEGWQLLFDGESFNGWRGYNMDSFPVNSWEITDGTLHSLSKGRGKQEPLTDLITVNQYQDFEFSTEWIINQGIGSAIFILIQENNDIPLSKSGIGFRLADITGNTEKKHGKEEHYGSNLITDILPCTTYVNTLKNEWNQTRIIQNKGKTTMFVNGEKVMEFELWTKDWENTVSQSRYKGIPGIIHPGGSDKKGFIGLQNNGSDVSFRNIKIREIENKD